jgi:hypothetical protein
MKYDFYTRKRNTNEQLYKAQLYKAHLQAANTWGPVWNIISNNIHENIRQNMTKKYHSRPKTSTPTEENLPKN